MIRQLVEAAAKRLPRRRILDPIHARPYLDRYYVAGAPGALRAFPKNTRAVLGWLPFTVYLHHIRQSDWDREALHDHPWDAVSLVLAGGYIEERLDGDRRGDFSIRARWRGAGTVARVGGELFHRIELLADTTAWTLFIVGRKRKTWSFFVPSWPKTVAWRDYIQWVADRRSQP
ncbi:MAG: hypothetical protein K0V04_20060 [Deltaproteobacteria bacterium]|nr:hypothetical protein [Deltaproteobacteria bacterium]